MRQDQYENMNRQDGHDPHASSRHEEEPSRYESIRYDHKMRQRDAAHRDHGEDWNDDGRGDYGQLEYQLEDFSKQNRNQCFMPSLMSRKQSKTKRVIVLCLIYSCLIPLVSLQGCIFVYQIMTWMNNSIHIDTSTPEYTLYKNSLFKECSANTTAKVDCAILEDDRNRYLLSSTFQRFAKDHHFISTDVYENESMSDGGLISYGTEYSWCELASCLNNFKIIPSIPRDSAYGLTGIKAWSTLLVSATLGLWNSSKTPTRPEKCKGARMFDWLQLLPSVASIGWWWWAFASFARDRSVTEPVSLVNWMVAWSLATSLDFHPWRCSYPDSRPRRTVVVALRLLLFVQACATVYPILSHFRDVFQRYDCFPSGIAAAPGNTSCTAEELCSKTWMFSNPDMLIGADQMVTFIYGFGVVPLFAVYALTLVWLAGTTIMGRPYWAEKLKKRLGLDGKGVFTHFLQTQSHLGLGILGILCTPFVLAPPSIFDYHLNTPGGPATLAYDLDCRAVHIGVSPRYYYLDIDHGRTLRIVRTWFAT